MVLKIGVKWGNEDPEIHAFVTCFYFVDIYNEKGQLNLVIMYLLWWFTIKGGEQSKQNRRLKSLLWNSEWVCLEEHMHGIFAAIFLRLDWNRFSLTTTSTFFYSQFHSGNSQPNLSLELCDNLLRKWPEIMTKGIWWNTVHINTVIEN